MTNSEIRALVYSRKALMESRSSRADKIYVYDPLVCAIETLLEREAAVLKTTHPGPRPHLSFPGEGVAMLKWRQKRETYRAIRAILNPEENSNG